MERISISKATQRDLENVKDAARELWQDIRSPLFWLGLAILTFFIVAPWLLDGNDLPW